MIKNSFLVILVIGAIFSGCVSKGAAITGTYTHTYKEHPSFSKVLVEEFTFYDDGTWVFQSPTGTNSGVYKIQDKDIILTGQLMTAKFTVLDNGSLQGSEPEPWVKQT
jgi:hypothetical protein